jgi:DNA-directed RNA polymerase subunit F
MNEEAMQDTNWSDEVLAALRERLANVERLHQLSSRQGEMIAAKRTDALLGVLSQRQALIDRILSTQDRFHAMAIEVTARISELAPDRRAEIRSILDTTESRLVEILERDKSDEDVIRARRSEIKDEVSANTTARRAHTAYVSARPASTNRFADRQG